MICIHIYFRERERRGEGRGGGEQEGGRERLLCARYYCRLGFTTMNKTAQNRSSHGVPILVCVCVWGGTDTNNKKVNKYSVTVLDSDMLQKNKVG